MTRPAGFQTADMDVGLLEDGKFRLVWRRLQDPALMCQATTLYVAAVLGSWQAGSRLPLGETMPMWLDPAPAVLAALREVGLIDDESKIPERAWQAWYGPAHRRREERIESGRKGGLSKGGNVPDPAHG